MCNVQSNSITDREDEHPLRYGFSFTSYLVVLDCRPTHIRHFTSMVRHLQLWERDGNLNIFVWMDYKYGGEVGMGKESTGMGVELKKLMVVW